MTSADEASPEKWTYARMYGHITQKGFQAGSILSSVIMSPALWRGNVEMFVGGAGKGAVIGVILADALGAYKLTGEPKEAVEDRVYRLYYNQGQNRCDTFAQAGMAAGLLAVLATRGRSGTGILSDPWQLVGGAALGTAVGVLAHGATAPQKPKLNSKSVSDSIDKMK